MDAGFISNFGILILVITLISFGIKIFKQPIILGYVLAGLAFAFIISHSESMNEILFVFQEIGITFLLFLMGIEFDLKGLKYFGKDIFIASLIQSIIFFILGFGVAIPFGLSYVEAAYIGILFMFSSTLLAAKWVDDKKETNTLHGKITLSILIIQDVFAILILTFLSVLEESSLTKILFIPLKGILLIGIAFVLAKYLLNIPLRMASKYPELLFLTSLSVCFGFVVLAPVLGQSTTIGAFIGGIVLANTLYKADVMTRVKPLVTFFNMLFFVGLGFQMDFSIGPVLFVLIGVLCLLSLTVKPFIVYLTLRMRGYDMKTSFLSGIYLSQLSEFGIIIFAGAALSGSLNSIAIISIIASMIFSSYLIKYDKSIFKYFEERIIRFDKRFITKDVSLNEEHHEANILFFGYYDINKELFAKFQRAGKKILVVENDPENIALLRKENIPCVYNSINNPEFFEHLNFRKVDLVVSNLTDLDENEILVKEIKKFNPKSLVIVTAKHLKESLELYKIGADYVIYSPSLRDEKVSVILDDYTTDINKVIEKKLSDLHKLKERDAKLSQVRGGGFRDIDSFLGTMSPRFSRRKKFEEVNDEAGDRDSLPEHSTWGDKYI